MTRSARRHAAACGAGSGGSCGAKGGRSGLGGLGIFSLRMGSLLGSHCERIMRLPWRCQGSAQRDAFCRIRRRAWSDRCQQRLGTLWSPVDTTDARSARCHGCLDGQIGPCVVRRHLLQRVRRFSTCHDLDARHRSDAVLVECAQIAVHSPAGASEFACAPGHRSIPATKSVRAHHRPRAQLLAIAAHRQRRGDSAAVHSRRRATRSLHPPECAAGWDPVDSSSMGVLAAARKRSARSSNKRRRFL